MYLDLEEVSLAFANHYFSRKYFLLTCHVPGTVHRCWWANIHILLTLELLAAYGEWGGWGRNNVNHIHTSKYQITSMSCALKENTIWWTSGSGKAKGREMGKDFTEVTKGENWALFLTITFKARINLFILQNWKSKLRMNAIILSQNKVLELEIKTSLSYSEKCSCGSACFLSQRLVSYISQALVFLGTSWWVITFSNWKVVGKAPSIHHVLRTVLSLKNED